MKRRSDHIPDIPGIRTSVSCEKGWENKQNEVAVISYKSVKDCSGLRGYREVFGKTARLRLTCCSVWRAQGHDHHSICSLVPFRKTTSIDRLLYLPVSAASVWITWRKVISIKKNNNKNKKLLFAYFQRCSIRRFTVCSGSWEWCQLLKPSGRHQTCCIFYT